MSINFRMHLLVFTQNLKTSSMKRRFTKLYVSMVKAR